ncbi:MAG: histidine kinase, partial [Actinomycetota bacterium]|nr:histidine kinase [Actinomycetota bacterium]
AQGWPEPAARTVATVAAYSWPWSIGLCLPLPLVGARSGQQRLDSADRAALELLAAPLAVAVHATALSAAVQRSRQHIIAAREEERRRLRRDLHDGLGPALTGMAFQADAIGNLLRTEPDRAAELITALRISATEAIGDVRRLVYALRPPALDELGLVGALRRRAEQLGAGGREPAIRVDVPESLPALPAAVEVAAYRIAVEALNNAVRHAGAARVDLRLEVNGALEIAVSDDGRSDAGSWAAGVGLSSIGERAAELGGQWRAGPADGGGGLVWARLPLGSAD